MNHIKMKYLRGKNMKKKFMVCTYVLLFAVCVKLGFQYCYNEYLVRQCEEGEKALSTGPLMVINWVQPYLAHYNTGNIHFENEQYEEAIKEYKEALNLDPGKEEECEVRINLALAMVYSLGEDYDSEENRENSLKVLKEAKEVLLENGCAKEDGNGHNETAQELKEEIDDMIRKLEPQSSKQEKEEDKPTEPTEPKEPDNTNQIEVELKKEQKKAYEARTETMNRYEEENMEFDFGGKVW